MGGEYMAHVTSCIALTGTSAAVGTLQPPIRWLPGERWLGHDSLVLRLRTYGVISHFRHMPSWRTGEQPAEIFVPKE